MTNPNQPPGGQPAPGWAMPPPPPQQRPLRKKWWFWLIIAIVTVILIAVAAFAWVVTSGTSEAAKAVESCEQKAIAQAKYPGAAKIVSTNVGEFETLPNGNKTLPVEGEIDMPNAFGTPVRHTYWCGLMMILEDGTIINDDPLVLPKN